MVSNRVLWLVTVINGCSGILVSPLLLYYLRRFYRRKDELFISIRYPRLVLITCILTVITSIVLSSLNSLILISPLKHTHHSIHKLVASIQNAVSCLLLYSINWLFITRVWLMSYDLHYSNSNVNKQWKSHLDPSLIDKDFWLKHKQKCGSITYVSRLTFVANCIFTTLSVVTVHLHIGSSHATMNALYVHATLHLGIVILLLALYATVRSVLDLFYLKWEILMHVISKLLAMLCAFGANRMYKLEDDTLSLIGLVLRMNAGIIAYVTAAFASTWWIMRKLDGTFNDSYSQHPNHHKSRQLQRILLDAEHFELFVQHLAREFSVETILAFIEMVQFKHIINSKFDVNLGRMDSDIGITSEQTDIYFDFYQCDITTNKAIPKSALVYKTSTKQSDHDDLKPFVRIAHGLYHKYIQIGSELEVNISGECRDIYVDEMECGVDVFLDHPMEAIDLFEYFDLCIEEMYCLLATSCARFLETDKNVNIARIQLGLRPLDTNQIEKSLTGTLIRTHPK
eukprot:262820_1